MPEVELKLPVKGSKGKGVILFDLKKIPEKLDWRLTKAPYGQIE
jgi:hypothetical protein